MSIFLLSYIAISLSGFAALMVTQSSPGWSRDEYGNYVRQPGLDVTLSLALFGLLLSFIPIINVLINGYWVMYAHRRLWRDHHDGRPFEFSDPVIIRGRKL